MLKINFKKINPFLTSINIIIILVFINLFLGFYPFLRIDFSQNKIHSLSPATRKTVKDLNDVVNIKVFMSKELPADVRPTVSNLKTILSELEKINKNRLKITYADPATDSEAKAEADRIGIQQLQFSSAKSDKLEVTNGYIGLSMSYGENKIVLPVAGDIGNLEYFIVSGIKKITLKTTPKVALVEESANTGKTELQYFRKFLEQNYAVSEHSLDSDSEVAKDAQALIVIGRKNKLSEKSQEKIKRWIDEGKALIVFLDRVDVNTAMQPTKIPETGLEQILKEYGIEIEQKLIVDDSGSIASFRTTKGQFLIKYPYWVQIRPENINRTIPALSGISSLNFEWASPLKLSGEAKEMFSSSVNTVVDDSFSDLSPMAKKDFSGDKSKQIIGAVNNSNVKLAVIGDADFIKDQFVVNNQQNLGLSLNLVDYFSQDSSLMTIRSKNIKNSPLIAIPDTIKPIIKYMNIALPVVILAAAAILSRIIRKKKNSNW